MPDLNLRFGGYQPARSVHTRAMHVFGNTLRQHLAERISVEIIDNVTVLGHRADDLLSMTAGDALDICYFSSSYLAKSVPSLQVLDSPFQFAERQAAYALLDGAAGQRMAEEVAQATEYRVLGFWDNGFRHISNGRHAIRAPTDCAGLRIRTLDNAMHQAFFRRLGFEPVFVDVKDLVSAVADGKVDAQENPLTNLVNFELYRFHRFVSLTAHLFGVALLLVNRARFDDWPEDVRAAVQSAADTATVSQRRDAEAEDDICLNHLIADGVDIVAADRLDHAAFARLARTT